MLQTSENKKTLTEEEMLPQRVQRIMEPWTKHMKCKQFDVEELRSLGSFGIRRVEPASHDMWLTTDSLGICTKIAIFIMEPPTKLPKYKGHRVKRKEQTRERLKRRIGVLY